MHQIKGVVGNLRFTNCYELSVAIEKALKAGEKVQDIEKDVELLLSHLQELYRQTTSLLDGK